MNQRATRGSERANSHWVHGWGGAGRAILFFVLCGIEGRALGQRTPDEINTVEVFKRAAPAIVHVRSVQAPRDDQAAPGESTGSGFLIDQAGHVLTNYHVIANSVQVKLLVSGGHAFGAVLVGTAPAFDIALLKINGGEQILAQFFAIAFG